jgi:DNA-binding transcriptional regulator YiaG
MEGNRHEMTPAEFKQARKELGLSVRDLAWVLNVGEKTIRIWERANDRAPAPTAVRCMVWFQEGFRPADWPKDTSTDDQAEALP